jgi:glycosyltransferase involved in cell wall biosynthesis
LQRLKEMWTLDMVEFAGHVGEPTDIWLKEQALILPSRSEAFPMALVEAMLCGRPSIVTNVGDNGTTVEDNVSGFVAAAATVEHLDEALERAFQRREEWPDIGIAAGRRIREVVPADPVGQFTSEIERLL